jgi:hypothetical protein
MGNAIDGQDDSLASVAVTVAAVAVVLREESSNSEAIVNFSFRTSAEKDIIPVHSKRLATRPAAAVLFHASEKIIQNLTFLLR